MASIDLRKYKAKPNETLHLHTENVKKGADILYSKGYIIDERIYNLLKLACHYHDFGKVNPEFQKRIEKKSRFDDKKEVGHNILSVFFFGEEDFDEDKFEDYAIVFNAVLNHHHYCKNNLDALYYLIDMYDKMENLLGAFNLPEFDERVIPEITDIIENNPNATITKISTIVQGLLYKCDYAASASSELGADIDVEYPNDFLLDHLDKWQENYDIKWNNLQRYCKENCDRNIIVTAPTGMGKTEAALLWLGNQKGFYVLPLKTAINAIYDRIRLNILEDKDIDLRLGLLHSDSSAHIVNNSKSKNFDIKEYKTKGKQLSLPLSISTPDQLFDFVFKYPGYELKPATFSYSKIIIDEIQAYSAELLAYIVCGLEQIVELGGKVAILTATLPPYIRDVLPKKISFTEADFYPDSLTPKRHCVKALQNNILDEEAINMIVAEYKIRRDKRGNCKTLIVCNTIKKAQMLYDILSEKLPNEEINLLHSKFIKKDRTEKERAIIQDGKTEVKKNVIWISTQIVEASLDIDFDIIFSELSELNGLFQRLGRCNRKGVKEVNDKEYNCYVFTNIDDNILTNANGTRGFIDRGLYELSKEALERIDGIISEKKKCELINDYLTTEKLNEKGKNKKSIILEDYKKHYAFIRNLKPNNFLINMENVSKNFRNIVSYEVIPESVYYENLEDIKSTMEGLKNCSYEDRIRLENKIKQLTVPVGYWDIYLGEKQKSQMFAINENGEKITIDLNNYTEINVVQCNYDKIRGFIRATKEAKNEVLTKDNEDFSDSFI